MFGRGRERDALLVFADLRENGSAELQEDGIVSRFTDRWFPIFFVVTFRFFFFHSRSRACQILYKRKYYTRKESSSISV